MEIAESTTEFQRSLWSLLRDDSTTHTENRLQYETTEVIVYDVTKFMTSNMSFDDQKENYENKSLCFESINEYEKIQNCNMTLFSLYPSGILWLGAIFCIVYSIVGTVANLISILAMVKCRRLRNATTAFVVNLCASDMLFCSFSMPLTAVVFLDRNWNNGVVLCKLFAFIKFTNALASIFTIIAITVNRYVLIVYPKSYPVIYTQKKTAIIIASLWLFPLSLISLPLFNVWGTLEFNPRIGDCAVMYLNGKSPRPFIFAVAMVLPIIIFIGCYLKIYFVVKNSVGNIKKKDGRVIPECTNSTSVKVRFYKHSKIYIDLRQKKEYRFLRIVLAIFILHIISTFPMALVKLLRKETELPAMNILAYVFYFSSSVLNPVIYIVMSREYRIAYKELFSSSVSS